MAFEPDYSLNVHLFFIPDPVEYNCSAKTVEEWEMERKPSLLVGYFFILQGVVSLGVYGLLFLAMTSKEILHNSCFQLMYFNCVIDSGSIAVGGLITGWLYIRGDVFCTNPFWTYAPGGFGLGCWSASCVLCIALALSRICAIHRSEWRKTTYIFMGIAVCHGIFMTFCTRNPVFNSVKGSWFFSPFIQGEFYTNYYHFTENALVTVLTPIMYGYVCIKLFFNPTHHLSSSNRRLQVSVCFQSCLISSLVIFAAVFFAYMQIFPYPSWMPLVSEIAYQICGILFSVNKKIRMRAKCILLFKNPSAVRIASTTRASEKLYKMPSEPQAGLQL